MSRFCPHCGAELSPGDRFCPTCGVAVPDSAIPPKAVGQEPLSGTAFVEKSKEWARPQKGGMRPGFIVLLVLLLFAFFCIAVLLAMHLFGTGSTLKKEAISTTEPAEAGQSAPTEEASENAQADRALSETEQAMLDDFIAQFEQKVSAILVQNWDGTGVHGAYALENYVLEGSSLWKGLDAQTGAWNGGQKQGLPELETYKIIKYTVQWDGDVLILHTVETITGKDPAGEPVSMTVENIYMLEQYFGNYRCFDSRSNALLAALDTYYRQAVAANLEFWVIAGGSRYYTDEELREADAYELSILRNGMYALSGKQFTKNRQVMDFFQQYYWYIPDTEDDEIARSRMNEYQLYNVTRVLEMEREKGFHE